MAARPGDEEGAVPARVLPVDVAAGLDELLHPRDVAALGGIDEFVVGGALGAGGHGKEEAEGQQDGTHRS